MGRHGPRAAAPVARSYPLPAMHGERPMSRARRPLRRITAHQRGPVEPARRGPMTDAPRRGETDATRVFSQHRDVLMAVAYRLLGRVVDAEDDVVQDAWLRWTRARPSEVADPRAFLVR